MRLAGGGELPVVSGYRHLGVERDRGGSSSRAVAERVAAAWRAYYAVAGGVLRLGTLSHRFRGAIYMAVVRPVVVRSLRKDIDDT